MTNFTLIEFVDSDVGGGKFIITVLEERHLRVRLEQYRRSEPKIIDLIGPEGDCLNIGISNELGFLQYVNSTGDPPYLVAVNSETENTEDGEFEFDYAGNVTPIPLRWCIPTDRAIEIAVDFFRHKAIPQNVVWQEV